MSDPPTPRVDVRGRVRRGDAQLSPPHPQADTSDTLARARAELERFLSSEAVAALDGYFAALNVQLGTAEAQQRRWLKVEEAAALLGCSPAALRKRLDRGRLSKHRQGGRLYIDRLELDDTLEQSDQ